MRGAGSGGGLWVTTTSFHSHTFLLFISRESTITTIKQVPQWGISLSDGKFHSCLYIKSCDAWRKTVSNWFRMGIKKVLPPSQKQLTVHGPKNISLEWLHFNLPTRKHFGCNAVDFFADFIFYSIQLLELIFQSKLVLAQIESFNRLLKKFETVGWF